MQLLLKQKEAKDFTKKSKPENGTRGHDGEARNPNQIVILIPNFTMRDTKKWLLLGIACMVIFSLPFTAANSAPAWTALRAIIVSKM